MPCRVTRAQLKTVLHQKSNSHFLILFTLCLYLSLSIPHLVTLWVCVCVPTSLPHMKRLSGRTSHEAALAHAHTQFHKSTHTFSHTQMLMNERFSDPWIFTSLADQKCKSEKNKSRWYLFISSSDLRHSLHRPECVNAAMQMCAWLFLNAFKL